MELNINITIDLSQSVKSLLQGFNLSSVARVQEPHILLTDEYAKKEVKAPVESAPVKVKEESVTEGPVKEGPVKKEPVKKEPVKKPVKEETTEKPDAEVKQDAPGISDVELRREIKECRERIMQGKTDPLLKAQINGKLREKVSQMGFDSSTKLPQDKRQEFVEYCRTLIIENNDEAPF